MTGTELSIRDKMDYAKALSSASLLPKSYRENPANILLAIEYGDALGVPPIQAINSIHVIEGKPSASADLLASLVRRAGHRLRVTEENTTAGPVITATLIRADDPEFAYTAQWDMAKATAAKLLNKDNWVKYPGQMMRARAITEVCRMGASDALYGVIYTPEELGAHEVTVSHVPTPQPAPVMEEPSADEVLAGEPLITASQQRKIGGLMKAVALDRAGALAFAADVIGHPLATAKDLTEDEAGLVIAALEDLASQEGSGVTESVEQVDPATGELVTGGILIEDGTVRP